MFALWMVNSGILAEGAKRGLLEPQGDPTARSVIREILNQIHATCRLNREIAMKMKQVSQADEVIEDEFTFAWYGSFLTQEIASLDGEVKKNICAIRYLLSALPLLRLFVRPPARAN